MKKRACYINSTIKTKIISVQNPSRASKCPAADATHGILD